MNSAGEIVGCAKGQSTNPLLVGTTECKKRILDLINKSKKAAGLTEDTPLDGLVRKHILELNILCVPHKPFLICVIGMNCQGEI